MNMIPESALSANMNPLGSDVLSQDDLEQFEQVNEMYVSGLMKAVEASNEAKMWLNTTLGKELRQFVMKTKQSSMIILAGRGSVEDKEVAQRDYDTICGVEQFFGNMLVAGKVSEDMLQQKEEINNAQETG